MELVIAQNELLDEEIAATEVEYLSEEHLAMIAGGECVLNGY